MLCHLPDWSKSISSFSIYVCFGSFPLLLILVIRTIIYQPKGELYDRFKFQVKVPFYNSVNVKVPKSDKIISLPSIMILILCSVRHIAVINNFNSLRNTQLEECFRDVDIIEIADLFQQRHHHFLDHCGNQFMDNGFLSSRNTRESSKFGIPVPRIRVIQPDLSESERRTIELDKNFIRPFF